MFLDLELIPIAISILKEIEEKSIFYSKEDINKALIKNFDKGVKNLDILDQYILVYYNEEEDVKQIYKNIFNY
jgi:hypothetical protein